MTRRLIPSWALASLLVLAACGTGPRDDLIFFEGRAVAPAGDSVLVFTRRGTTGVIVRDRRSGAVYTRAVRTLRSPHHVESAGNRWYISDAHDGRAAIAVFNQLWELERTIAVDTITGTPHQFAVLPDGRIILEAPDGRLVALGRDTITTFALTEQDQRTGLLLGALGGVLHAVPGHSVTLYNDLGHWRWRLEWQWHEGAYVTDLAIDTRGRIHLLAGEEDGASFVTFTLSPTTGEVVRWSLPGQEATFTVDRLGNLEPVSSESWVAGLVDQPGNGR